MCMRRVLHWNGARGKILAFAVAKKERCPIMVELSEGGG